MIYLGFWRKRPDRAQQPSIVHNEGGPDTQARGLLGLLGDRDRTGFRNEPLVSANARRVPPKRPLLDLSRPSL